MTLWNGEEALSKDPLFIDKARDVVGLYLHPPEKALVLCVDEKSQTQALDRTQPVLPMRPGQVERRTHDYTRYGTTSLFAALNVKTGTVIGECYPQHRAREFRKFLDVIDAAVPADLDVHLILDNYPTHKTTVIRRWLAKRPRYHLHFTPTSASWLRPPAPHRRGTAGHRHHLPAQLPGAARFRTHRSRPRWAVLPRRVSLRA